MSGERYRVGDLRVNATTGAVMRGSQRLKLPPLSFALLVSLLRRAPDMARRQDLIDEVWQGTVVGDETLSQRVRLLREALGESAREPRYIEGVRGWGYRMAQPVERESAGYDRTASVAVLPFDNLDGRPEDLPLCEGLAEEITNALAGVKGLRVIARTSAAAVGRAGIDAREAGRRLGVGSLVEGSVRRAGNRVRVTVQLVETAEGGHLWSELYDREFRDVFALEDEIAVNVARRLRRDLAQGDLVRPRRPVDPAAHDAYLNGRHLFHSGAGPHAMTRAMAALEQAVELDPNFAAAFDALAEIYWYLGFFGSMRPRDAFGQSTWYALRALELDDSLADTHALLAMLRKELDYNWPEVDREMAHARRLNRDSPAVQVRSAVSGLLPHGRLDEALAEIDRALDRDPLSIFVRWWSAAIAYLARRPQRMTDEGRRIVALEDHHPFGHWALGMALELDGDPGAALPRLEQAARLSGDASFFLGFQALAQGLAGEHHAARATIARLERPAAERYIQPGAVALAHIGLGEWDEAFLRMEAAIDERDPLVIPIKSFHFMDPVRDDPRYLALLRSMNMPA